uniref:Putative dehydrogenase n=1 Tax=Tabanus bromius TaxID=304241 RepID=A0A0K8TT77_TABBR
MDRWRNKVAVVTGASSGIGAAIAKDLIKAGLTVVGLARREGRVADLCKDLSADLRKKLIPIKCDVSVEKDVKSAFQVVDTKFNGVDILINNAGIVRQTELVAPDQTQPIRETLETNVMGVYYCTREAFNIMKRRNVDGHIVIINSVAGHTVPYVQGMPSFNMYPASKYAITAMTETYRREFNAHGTKIKITSISPGLVETEILGDEAKKKEVMGNVAILKPEDISGAVLYALSTPPHVQVHDLIIRPVGEIF